MMSSGKLQLFGLALLASVLQADHDYGNHLVIAPQGPVVEVAANFTATCLIINTDEVTADDLYWNLSSKGVVPEEYYTKINASALAVTFPITSEISEWLFCQCKKTSPYVFLNGNKFTHGIWLKKGYRPVRAENLTCVAKQSEEYISRTLQCSWTAANRQTAGVTTYYTVFVQLSGEAHNVTTHGHKANVLLGNSFPHHMDLDVWVVSHNSLGSVESEHLTQMAEDFVKTNPPQNIKVITEDKFPTSLFIKWEHPIKKEYLSLTYQIRFCLLGSQNWSYVPEEDMYNFQTSYRLQNLQPYKTYLVQLRCRYKKNRAYWSDWSATVVNRTNEDSPGSKPDLWQISGIGQSREVELVCKNPELSNGRITLFSLKLRYENEIVEQETISVDETGTDQNPDERKVTLRRHISLADKSSVNICITANNSAGRSPVACLFLPVKQFGQLTGDRLRVQSQQGHMFVEWKRPLEMPVSEYVIEWSGKGTTDWQREKRSTNRTAIKGKLEKFVCYNVSVYAIHSGIIWRLARTKAFLEEGVPKLGPSISNSNPAYDNAELVWDEIPVDQRRGFITNYTITYKKENQPPESIYVPANVTSFTLPKLSGNTKYDVWISASTSAGSVAGNRHTFTTLKYAPGMVEGIVVGVSLGFLFLALIAILLFIYKKDVIKENLWPQIPNPGESTIGSWSPDYPPKAETPKENCVSGICVLDVGVCEVKHGFEEDKSSLPLKKDKYLSEEHSSGIGGSSCMSSPRQSVSDSDEGPDLADSTASTVQYSSVVASSGYKRQTPGSQSQHYVFSRSESTQPLLDSEEHPDVSAPDGCREVQGSSIQSSFAHNAETQKSSESGDVRLPEVEQQDFCPLREDMEPDGLNADADSAAASSYMPQLAGYRSQ